MVGPQQLVLKKVRLTLRMPESWRDRVTDRKLSKWLHSMPPALASDPGGGSFRRSFALTVEEFSQVKRQASTLRVPPSTLVRRLIATHLDSSKPVREQRRITQASTPGRLAVSSPTERRREALPAPPLAAVLAERDGKAKFEGYVSELERLARSGSPETGEAQVRLAKIRDYGPLNLTMGSGAWGPIL